ncbi:staygreen family protein [Siminovitchia sediminis]|uniref:Staygreen family protein n=1 Tax=Siminovitchia sediminis TaxID=1274353 RepID=A0ABW4KFL8_9BACI
MKKLQSDPCSVAILPPATAYKPVDGRKYTFIMSTSDQHAHLTIGYKYTVSPEEAYTKKMLTAEWRPRLGEYILSGTVHIHDSDTEEVPQSNLEIQTELPHIISTLIEADKSLYLHVPWLLDAPIYIEINLNKRHKTIQYYGTPRQYLNHQ